MVKYSELIFERQLGQVRIKGYENVNIKGKKYFTASIQVIRGVYTKPPIILNKHDLINLKKLLKDIKTDK